MITLRPYTATARSVQLCPLLAQGRPVLDTEGERSGSLCKLPGPPGEPAGNFILAVPSVDPRPRRCRPPGLPALAAPVSLVHPRRAPRCWHRDGCVR